MSPNQFALRLTRCIQQACCESYVEQNLATRCFVRNSITISEDFARPGAVMKAVDEYSRNAAQHEQWEIVPNEARFEFSPLLLARGAISQIGLDACKGISAACVPIYRVQFLFVFKAAIAPWFQMGAICVRYTNEGDITGPFLVHSGLATAQPGVDDKYKTASPCIFTPSLNSSWNASRLWLNSKSSGFKNELLKSRR